MIKSRFIYPLVGIVFLLLAWQSVSCLVGQSWLLPSPGQTMAALAENYALLLGHSRYTVGAALSGLALAIFVALLLSLLLSLSVKLRQTVYPLLMISQMVPVIVLAPLFIVWLGYGLLPKILVVALSCFFPMIINCLAGLNAADHEMLAFFRAMGLSKAQLFRIVRLPLALPYFFSGLRVAAAYSVMSAVIGEWLGAQAGLGLLLTRAQRSFDLPLVFADIIVIVLWSGIIFALVMLLERIFLRSQRAAGEEWDVA